RRRGEAFVPQRQGEASPLNWCHDGSLESQTLVILLGSLATDLLPLPDRRAGVAEVAQGTTSCPASTCSTTPAAQDGRGRRPGARDHLSPGSPRVCSVYQTAGLVRGKDGRRSEKGPRDSSKGLSGRGGARHRGGRVPPRRVTSAQPTSRRFPGR